MSQSRLIQYKCPYCGKEFETEVWDSIHADEDEDLRERCISSDLFRVSCPHCKKEFMIQFPLIYIDKKHKFVLWESQSEVGDELKAFAAPLVKQGWHLRRTPTVAEFSEKIQIFEDGIDDRLVELAKYDSFIEVINSRKAKTEDITSVEYQKTEDDVMKINVRMSDKGMAFLIPVDGVREEMEQNRKLFEIDETQFPVINSEWMISLYSGPAARA